MSKTDFVPDWTESAPQKGTYRSIFKWGAPDGFKHPNPGLYALMKEIFQLTDEDFTKKQSEGNETVTCDRPINLSEEQISVFKSIVGEENVATDDYSRVLYANGKTAEEALKLRQGIVSDVADLVVHPRNKEDVQKIVKYCNAQKISVSPYGGGSSVTLGLECVKGGISLVMKTHMNRIIEFNETNQTITVEAGMMGPDYEKALNHDFPSGVQTNRYSR